MASPVETAARIIVGNRYMTLATARDDEPWASAVAYAWNADLEFVWFSATTAVHSENAAVNPKAVAAIFNSTEPSDTVNGVQTRGSIDIVDGPDLQSVMDHYFAQSFPDRASREKWQRPRESFLGDQPLRFYRLTADELWVLDETFTDFDRRRPVDLKELKALLRERQ